MHSTSEVQWLLYNAASDFAASESVLSGKKGSMLGSKTAEPDSGSPLKGVKDNRSIVFAVVDCTWSILDRSGEL